MATRHRAAAMVLTAALVLAACAEPGGPAASEAAEGSAARAPRAETVAVPVKGGGVFAADIDMVTRVYKPEGTPPFPVVVYSHGRSGAATRTQPVPPPPAEQIRYWLGRGFAVVAPVRPGYGQTGGPDLEFDGSRFDRAGTCTARPDYRATTRAGEHAIGSALTWLRTQPWADANRVILVGQSVGGMVTVASAAEHPAGVIGYVNFAGGDGGNPRLAPGRPCDPKQLGQLYAEFGRTTTVPNLWVYSQNDQFWGEDVPSVWHAVFAAGGSPTQFVHAPPVSDGNGHGLSAHSRQLWAPYLDRFLRALPALQPAPG